MRELLLQWCVVIYFVCCAGCSNAPATVTGKVTLDGKPLTKGNVTFTSSSGQGVPASGVIQPNGNYSLFTGTDAGLLPGDYIVTIGAAEIPPATSVIDEPLPVLITPAKYNSRDTTDLKAKVVAGSNTFNFDLKSQ